jgi:hypothetical protein
MAGVAMLLLSGVSSSTRYSDLWPALGLLGLGIGTALTPMNLAALNSVDARNHGTVAAVITTLGGLGATFGVALSGAVFEAVQTSRIVSDAAGRGVHLTDSVARQLAGLLDGTPSASAALARYPAAQQPALRTAVHDGFISALGSTMRLSFALVIVAIILTLALIRSRPVSVAPRPSVAEPFSGLAPRP